MSEEQLKKWNDIVQELIDWNYGTVYKGYDHEELAECLEEDTRKFTAQLLELAQTTKSIKK